MILKFCYKTGADSPQELKLIEAVVSKSIIHCECFHKQRKIAAMVRK